jgi:hypothetical protein
VDSAIQDCSFSADGTLVICTDVSIQLHPPPMFKCALAIAGGRFLHACCFAHLVGVVARRDSPRRGNLFVKSMRDASSPHLLCVCKTSGSLNVTVQQCPQVCAERRESGRCTASQPNQYLISLRMWETSPARRGSQRPSPRAVRAVSLVITRDVPWAQTGSTGQSWHSVVLAEREIGHR